MDHRIRRERRAGLANGIDDNLVLGLVRDRQRETVIGAAAGISESSVKVVCGRQYLAIVASAGFDDFDRDEALDVRAELREILRRPRGCGLSPARDRPRAAVMKDCGSGSSREPRGWIAKRAAGVRGGEEARISGPPVVARRAPRRSGLDVRVGVGSCPRTRRPTRRR